MKTIIEYSSGERQKINYIFNKHKIEWKNNFIEIQPKESRFSVRNGKKKHI